MNEYLTFVQENTLLFVALVAVIFFIVKTEIGRLTRKYKQVNTNEAVHLMDKDDAVIIDVREDKEVTDGVIKGARHMPLSTFVSKIPELNSHKEHPVLVYCRSGSRSGTACNQLTKQGFSDVNNLAGGIMGWEADKLPISKR